MANSTFWLIAKALAALAVPAAANAQVNICEPLLSHGIYDSQNVMDSGYTISQAKSIVCRSDFETYQGASSSSTDVGINIPQYFEVTFGGKTTEENYKSRREQFCSLNDSGLNTSTNSYVNLKAINVPLAELYQRCVQSVQGAYAYVEPSSDLKKFTVHVKKSDGNLHIVKFTSSPTNIVCDAGLQEASANAPVLVDGSNSFICTRQDSSEPIILSGSTLNDGSLFKRTIELPGTSASLKSILDRLANVESSVTPSGQLAFFTSPNCPMGWSSIPRNWEGRCCLNS